MGLLDRLKSIFQAKVSKGLDAVENPKEMLDFGLEKLEEQCRSAGRSAAEVATAKRKLELQLSAYTQQAARYEEQAVEALRLGQESLAREAIAAKQRARDRAGGLAAQITGMEEQLQAIVRSQEELRAKTDAFRAKKEELKALYDASRAQLKIKELMTTIGKESVSVGQIIGRAEQRITDMQARVAAVDELVEMGVLEETFGQGGGDLERKISRLRAEAAVESDLARLKAELEASRKEDA